MNEIELLTNSSQTILDKSIEHAVAYALKSQNAQGYWVGNLDSNSTMEAEFLMLLHFLGVKDTKVQTKVVNHILQNQRADGTWGQYYQGPGDLSTTVECYFTLKLAGVSKDTPLMEKAREFIKAKGGISKTRVFTKIWLALFGQWPWEGIPILPPEIIHLPNWFPINVYEFASWARATILPLSIVLTERPICPIPEHAFLTELFPADFKKDSVKMPRPKPFMGWRGLFWIFDKLMRGYENLSWKPGRKSTIKKVLAWIVDHQEADGSWGGIQPPWVYSLIALKIMGYDLNHPVIKKGLKGFEGFSIETENTLQVQACVSPVWDTCLMMIALQDAGLDAYHPVLQTACRWMIKEQILSGGDWQIKNPNLPPGGWSFEYDNDQYPDIDDTAEVLIALYRTRLSEAENVKLTAAIERGTRWLTGMQSQNGGWAAFDKDNDNLFLTKLPFFDFGETLDPPSVDVTAHVIEALGRMGYKTEHPAIKRALQYIYDEQEKDGSWFGRWGVNYVYGTGSVLPALEAVGADIKQPCVRRAVEWLLTHQNADGGWGESCASYIDATQHGIGPSTASQTAWALLALMAADEWQSSAVKQGIYYLCNTMTNEGTWNEPHYTGCGFPGYGEGKRMDILPQPGETGYQGPELSAAFMINYNLYRHYWPLMALGRYQRYLQNKTKSTAN